MKEKINPMREAQRRYEKNHKEERKQMRGQFTTSIPRKEFDEINAFLEKYNIPKRDLIFEGYYALMEQYEPRKKE